MITVSKHTILRSLANITTNPTNDRAIQTDQPSKANKDRTEKVTSLQFRDPRNKFAMHFYALG